MMSDPLAYGLSSTKATLSLTNNHQISCLNFEKVMTNHLFGLEVFRLPTWPFQKAYNFMRVPVFFFERVRVGVLILVAT